MSTLTERTVIASIKVLADGSIEVERAAQVLRDDEVIASATSTQVLTVDQDLSAIELESPVLAVMAAVWTPEQVKTAADKLLAAMRETHQRQADDNAKALADLQRSREAVRAASKELDDEHAELATRSSKIAADRTAMLAEREALRQQSLKPVVVAQKGALRG